MGRFYQINQFTARLLGLGAGVFALMACFAWPAKAASAAPATPPPAAPNPAVAPATAPARPEDIAHDTLAAFLRTMEPTRLDDLAAQNPTREQVIANINQFDLLRRTKEFSDNCLYFLAKLPPDPKDYVETLARLTASLEQSSDDNGLLLLLFNLADEFPASQEPVQRMRIFQADFLLRGTGPETALVLLHKLADAPETTPVIRMLAAGRAGYMHERTGQTEEAIAAYQQAGADLSAGPSANEALVRATLLLLEMGRTDEALDLIGKLRGVPADVLRQSQATQPIIHDLLDLAANPDQARAYWRHHEVWQAAWSNLAGHYGVMPNLAGATVIAPYIDDYAQLDNLANNAVRTGNASVFFQVLDELFRSARWRPADLLAAADKLYAALSVAPKSADEIFAFAETLEKDLPPANAELGKSLAQKRVDALYKHDRIAEARDAAQAALARAGADGATGAAGQSLAFLFGLSVIQTGTADKYGQDAARILAGTLADPAAHGSQRVLAVAVLSDLYTSLGRDADALAVLETELARPTDPNDPNAMSRISLQSSLDSLRQRSLQAAGLEAGLTAWWKDHALPWYAYVTSPPQAGPLSTVDEPAVQVARDFARALDHSATPTQRLGALDQALSVYPEMFLSSSSVIEATTSFLARQELPMEIRYEAWARAELHLFWTGQRAAGEKLLASAPSGSTTAAQDRADFDLWDAYLAEPNTVAAQLAFADRVLALPVVHHASALLVAHIVNALASLNDVDSAQAVLDKLGRAKLEAPALEAFNEMSTTFKTLLANYRSAQPAAVALRQLVLDATPAAASAKLPAAWNDLNDTWTPDLSLLTQDETRQGLLVVIRDQLPYGRHPLQAFVDYANALTFNPDDAALRMKLFETAQKLANRDEDRFYAAFFTSIVDFDDPAVAARGWADLAPGRAKDFPKTSGFIQYYDTLMKWRTGAGMDPETAFGPLNSPDIDPFKLRLLLDYEVQQGDRAALQKLLDARDEKDFWQMPALGGYLNALKLLSHEAALTRASDAAHLELAADVAASWARPDIETAGQVFDLARALGEPKAYPREWVAAELAGMRNENAHDLIRIEDGRLQGDWAAVLDASTSYLSRNATNYDAYWWKAEALVQLGRRRDAIEPLRVYVKYSHNDDFYTQAVALLKTIEAEPPAGK